jgi:hypothetical protein
LTAYSNEFCGSVAINFGLFPFSKVPDSRARLPIGFETEALNLL